MFSQTVHESCRCGATVATSLAAEQAMALAREFRAAHEPCRQPDVSPRIAEAMRRLWGSVPDQLRHADPPPDPSSWPQPDNGDGEDLLAPEEGDEEDD